jgi:putative peptide zinc metalloprotease protein
MATKSRTFSESWHRIADLRVSLRHAVTVRKQLFRGETWYLLQDPFNNRFFRLSPGAHDFVVRLKSDQTVAGVWEGCLSRNPEEAPGQDEIIELLAQLYHADLLYCDLPPDSSRLFERYHQRRQRESRSKLFSLMFFRIPLFDPEPLLRKCAPLVRLLTGRLALVVWLLTVLLAVKVIIEQLPRAIDEAGSLLAFDNLVLLYLGLALVKILHEFGHTLVCKRLGGEVHTIGVMLIVFAPLPYMDATSSWAFRSRWQRILVASSGMLFEFFAAACAALLWANTGPGAVHSLAFNMMVVASVSTLLFNLNPLLRFDGYYILADLLEVPNLQPRAQEQLKHLASSHLFGDLQSSSPAHSRKEAFWLTTYGLCSGLYRFLVYGGIILFIADRFLLAGLVLAVICVITWGLMPIFRFITYLATSPKLDRNRPRAIAVTLASALILLVFLATVPMPNRFSSPGIVEDRGLLRIVNDAPGRVAEILTANGAKLVPGTPLARLVNPELEIEIEAVNAQRDEVLALQQQSLTLHGDSAREMLEKRLATLDNRLSNLKEEQHSLLVRAGKSGTWVAPQDYALPGVWLSRGTELGKIVAPNDFRFTAIVSQEEAANLFVNKGPDRVTVRLVGQGQFDLPVSKYEIIPFQHQHLPSAALGWQSGGDIPVTEKDEFGLQTVEPFFRIHALLQPQAGVVVSHGHSGRIRFNLPPEPLLSQLLRKARQFFQNRYQT